MAEVKREPVKIVITDPTNWATNEYTAFDENHTFNDVFRWLLSEGAEPSDFFTFMEVKDDT